MWPGGSSVPIHKIKTPGIVTHALTWEVKILRGIAASSGKQATQIKQTWGFEKVVAIEAKLFQNPM